MKTKYQILKSLLNQGFSKHQIRKSQLCGADLSGADLSNYNLINSDLSGTNLSGVNFTGANLNGANLIGANLDFSSLPLWCGSLKMKTDKKQRIQICYHFLSLIKYSENTTEEEKQIFNYLLNYANKFHRISISFNKLKNYEL